MTASHPGALLYPFNSTDVLNLGRINGVSLDSKVYVAVGDGRHRPGWLQVHHFGPGSVLGVFNNSGAFGLLSGIHLDVNDNVWLSDNSNDRLQLAPSASAHLLEQPPSFSGPLQSFHTPFALVLDSLGLDKPPSPLRAPPRPSSTPTAWPWTLRGAYM